MRPDLDALEALDAIIRYGGIAKAAVRLNKVQSAVTYQVRKLDDHAMLQFNRSRILRHEDADRRDA